MGFKSLKASIAVLFILTLWTMVPPAWCIVCTHNICDSIQCSEVKAENCPPTRGYIKPNGGYCGCCPKCITYLGENHICRYTFDFTTPISAECGPGLTCKDNKCQKISSDSESNES